MTAPDDLPAGIAGALAAMPDPALQASFPPARCVVVSVALARDVMGVRLGLGDRSRRDLLPLSLVGAGLEELGG